MTPGFAGRFLLRESRGSRGRLALFAACLSVGVAAVTGTAGIVEGIEAGVRGKSREVLGADVSVESRRPLPPELDRLLAAEPGIERTDLTEMATMAAVAGPDGKPAKSRLCQLRVVRGRWPLYGEVVLRPGGDLATLLAPDTAVVASELLASLGARVGDRVLLGGADFRVAAAVEREPARLGFQAVLGPRVFLSEEGLRRTSLLGFGNRVQHRALLVVPGNPSAERLGALKERLKAGLPGAAYLDIDTHYDAEPNLARQTERFRSLVGLTALLSLVLGGIGVAAITSAWLEGRGPSVAVLRCLGLRPREILVLYLGTAAVPAILGSLLGAALGSLLPLAVPLFAADLFPSDLFSAFQPAAALRGVGLGTGIALLFSLPPLTALWRVSPARAFRAEAEPLPPPRAVQATAGGLLAGGLFLAAWIEGGSATRAGLFTGGLALLAGLLALAARGAVRLAGALPRDRLRPLLRHGVAALARPGAGTTGAVVALGLGTMVVTAMALIESNLLDGLRASVPADAPSVFLVDVQPERWESIRGILVEEGATGIDHVPVVMARLSSVDGRSVEDLAAEAADGERARWVLTREQRLTWRATLPKDNAITAGALWSEPGTDEVSLEEGFARELGVGVGARLVFDVQGVPIPLRVTSLRRVEWTSFAINFFLVAEPGALAGAPSFEIANARLTEEGEQRVQDRLAAAAPSVTMIRLRPVLDRILGLMGRVALGIRILGSFTVAAGLAILAAAAGAATARRAREAALLKVLGVTRRGVAALFAVEFALAGFVAGTVGACGAALLAREFLGRVADLPSPVPVLAIPAAALGCAALSALSGLAATSRALRTRPVEALRGAG